MSASHTHIPRLSGASKQFTDVIHSHSSSSIGKRRLETFALKSAQKQSTYIKLSQGQLLYIKDNEEGWTKGTVLEVHDDGKAVVELASSERKAITKSDSILLRSESNCFAECGNLTNISPLNEASVLDCLHERFSRDIFYTTAGTTVVAVNPFKDLPHIYAMDKILEYHRNQALEPHIYLIAQKAYSNMVQELGKIDQSIVVSGESGAGKTVSAKHLLRYLTIVSSPEQDIDLDSSVPGSAIERRVLDSNPILEAFGNAATPRNENSSRFGKFIQLQFHRHGHILGGDIQTYLLEKTRVVHQGLGENNFHIFYQLLSLSETTSVPEWLEVVKMEVENSKLQSVLPQQETLSVLQTVNAMMDIGIAPATQVALFQVLLAILHLTTLKFVSSRDDEGSCISDDDVSNWAKDQSCRLLGISALSLHHVLLHRNIVSGSKTRRSVFVKPVSVAEAQSRRDCLVMLLYSRLFDWLVTFINHQIKASQFDHTISLLDIYGFEAFEINGLEQLCINYANERLQQHYVTYFLRDLQTEYEHENIPWTNVPYKDNRLCVEALDGSTGVFGVLNEEVYLSRKSDDSNLCGRIVALCSLNGMVRKPHAGIRKTNFCIHHYAGEVLYTVDGAVTKNKDNIPPELLTLMGTSNNSFVLSLFSDDEFAQTEQSLTPTKAKRKKTVLTKFKSSLDRLMSSLERSDVHYIRCIKPNTNSAAGHFDRVYVLQQLKACGTLETVDICRMGYPNRMTYEDFALKYSILNKSRHLPAAVKHVPGDGSGEGENKENVKNRKTLLQEVEARFSVKDEHYYRSLSKRLKRKSSGKTGDSSAQEDGYKTCASILMAVFPHEDLHSAHWQFGHSKIFLTQKQLEHLEHTRASALTKLTTRLQATWKAVLQRRRFRAMKEASVKVQTQLRMWACMQKFVERKKAVVKIQKGWRSHKLRFTVKRLARSSKIVKTCLTKWIRRRRFHSALQQLKPVVLTQESESMSYEQLCSEEANLSQTHMDTESSAVIELSLTNTEVYTPTPALCQGPSSCTIAVCENEEAVQHTLNIDENHVEDDASSQWSDDSGVMIRDETASFPADPSFEAPPVKKQKLTPRSDLRIGEGVVTCRRLTRPGFRFHVRKSVLQHGHVVHHTELPHGLPDALPEKQSGLTFDLRAGGDFTQGGKT